MISEIIYLIPIKMESLADKCTFFFRKCWYKPLTKKANQDIQLIVSQISSTIKLSEGDIIKYNINWDKSGPTRGYFLPIILHSLVRGRGLPAKYVSSPAFPLKLISSIFYRWSRAGPIVRNMRCVYSLPQRPLSRDEQALAGHIPRTHRPLSDDYNQGSHTV